MESAGSVERNRCGENEDGAVTCAFLPTHAMPARDNIVGVALVSKTEAWVGTSLGAVPAAMIHEMRHKRLRSNEAARGELDGSAGSAAARERQREGLGQGEPCRTRRRIEPKLTHAVWGAGQPAIMRIERDQRSAEIRRGTSLTVSRVKASSCGMASRMAVVMGASGARPLYGASSKPNTRAAELRFSVGA